MVPGKGARGSGAPPTRFSALAAPPYPRSTVSLRKWVAQLMQGS